MQLDIRIDIKESLEVKQQLYLFIYECHVLRYTNRHKRISRSSRKIFTHYRYLN